MLSSSSRRAPWRSAVWMVIDWTRLEPWSSTGQGWSHVLLSRLALLLQFFCLVIRCERIDQRIEPAFHHLIQLVHRETDPVIGNAILREIIGPDLLAAVARSHHAAPLGADLLLLLFQLDLVQARAKHAFRLGAVF